MALPTFPNELTSNHWDKKKNATAGSTGIGEKLKELSEKFGTIRTSIRTLDELETAQRQDDLQRLKDQSDGQANDVEAFLKKLRDFTMFASKKGAELSKKKLFPKDTLKLLDRITKKAESFDQEIQTESVRIRKLAAERLKRLAEQQVDNDPNPTLAAILKRLATVPAEHPLHFVFALGQTCGLVVTRQQISGGHRDAAKEMREGAGKLIEGDCHGENGVCIFVVTEQPPVGMARKIVAAAQALAQTRIRAKVRVAGQDGEDDSDDLEINVPPEPIQQDLQRRDELLAQSRQLAQKINELRESQPALGEALRVRFAEAVLATRGDLDRAAILLENVRKALQLAENKDPRAVRVRERWVALSEDFRAALELEGTPVEQLRMAEAQLLEALAKGENGEVRMRGVEDLVNRTMRDVHWQRTDQKRRREQHDVHDLMTRQVEVARNTTFRKGQAKLIAGDKSLDIGDHFKDVLKALGHCEEEQSDRNSNSLVAECQRYLKHVQKMSEKDRNKDATKRKVELVNKLIREARLRELANQYAQLQAPPWPQNIEDRANELQAAFFFEEGGLVKPGGRVGAKPLGGDGEGGANAAWWVQRQEPSTKNKPEGERLYIFKPIDAEDDALPGMGKGKSTTCEILAKVLGDTLGTVGLDPGVCPTTLCSIKSEMLPDDQGLTKDVDTRLGSMQKLVTGAKGYNVFRREHENVGELIDKDNYDEMAVLDLVFGSLDRHVKNILMQEDPQTGKVKMVPIDHGFGLPDRNGARVLRNRMITEHNVLMSRDMTQQRDQLLGPKARRAIKLLDPTVVSQSLRNAQDRMMEGHRDLGETVSNESFERVHRNVEFLKKAAEKLTVGELFLSLALASERIQNAREEELNGLIDTLKHEHELRHKGWPKIVDMMPSFDDSQEAPNRAAELRELGWFIFNDPNYTEAWCKEHAHEVSRILRGRIVNPEAQALIDEMTRDLGGAQRLALDGKTLYEQIKLLRDALLARNKPPRGGDQDAMRREIEQLGGAAVRKQVETFLCRKFFKLEDVLYEMRMWRMFQAEGGPQEFMRVGGMHMGTIEGALYLMRELKLQERAFSTVRELSDDEVTARQNQDVVRLARENRDKAAALRDATTRQQALDRLGPVLIALRENRQAQQINRGHAELMKIHSEFDRLLRNEQDAINGFNQRLATLTNSLTNLNQPGGPELRQRVQAFADQMPGMIDQGSLNAVAAMLARLEVEASILIQGDQSEYRQLERKAGVLHNRLANYAGRSVHQTGLNRVAQVRQELTEFDLRNGSAELGKVERSMDFEDDLLPLEQRVIAAQGHPRHNELVEMVAAIKQGLTQLNVVNVSSKLGELRSKLQSMGA
jgi:hypothetical protein